MTLYTAFSHRVLGLIISILMFASFIFAAAGDLDTSFLASATGSTNGNINVSKVQPDGKIIFGGFFNDTNGVANGGLFRLNADGTFDTSFNPPDFFTGFGAGGLIDAIALQSDGKILVGGRIYGINGIFKPGIYRLNTDGTVDTTFTVQQIGGDNTVNDIEVLSNNQFIVGGTFSFADIGGSRYLARFNANGSRDDSFVPTTNSQIITDIQLQPDGKILIIENRTSGQGLSRKNADGSIDSTFPTVVANGTINAIKLLPDNTMLIAGSFGLINGFTQNKISKINSDGSIDLNFNLNNPGFDPTNPASLIYDIQVRPNGKIIVVGVFGTYNSVARRHIAQLNADGSLDTSFVYSNTLNGPFFNITVLPNNQILIGTVPPSNAPSLFRLNVDGSLDTSYVLPVSRVGKVKKIVQQPDGKILFAGELKFAGTAPRNFIARVNLNGTVDTTFVPVLNSDTTINTIDSLALQPDGKILVGIGYNGGGLAPNLRRLNADGSLDTSFSTTLFNIATPIRDISVLPNGQILVAGNLPFSSPSSSKKIARLNANGSLDTTFVPDAVQPNADVYKILVQSDGKILIGGAFTQIGSSIRGRVARLNADGTLDTTFNPPGGANDTIFDLDVQTDGKVVLAGQFTGLNGSSTRQNIGRLNADGTIDAAFVQTTNAPLLAVKVQPSGKILIGGGMSQIGSSFRNGIARLNTDGSVDLTFNASSNSTVWDIIQQTDGKILTGGEFTRINGISAVRIARLQDNTVTARPLFDFDGDGKADVSVYRASTNTWYRLLSGNSTLLQNNFGIANDIPVPADFDGDGKTDLAIFRPSTGTFWYQSSVNNAQIATQWGQSGDIPRPSDFDGDGKADFIIYRPNEFQWYRLGSTGQVSNKSFGLPFDKPVIGDFDGDGKSDVAIFRPSSGDWWYQSSVDNSQRATHFGSSTDVPAPADFDGDGKTDFAVFRPSTGVWYVLNSSTGAATIVQFGISEDKPVPADYDGDGKSDIAVFRPSTGLWYLLQSTSGFSALQFGISSDVPLPNSFVP